MEGLDWDERFDEMHAMRVFQYLFPDDPDEDRDTNSPVADLLLPFGRLNESADCEICLTKESRIRNRSCCQIPVCDNCMKVYFVTQLENGVKRMQCISSKCSEFAPVEEIMCRLPVEFKDKFYKYLVDANNDPFVKTCPKCSFVQHVSKEQMNIPWKKKKYGLLVVCEDCNLEWCFVCHAPWHSEGVTCKEYQKGDKLVKKWAQEFHFGNKNAERCPKCKVFIERIRGCDHMTCGNCDTSFCYKCGERYTKVTFIGDHYGRFSPLGCKYRLHPNKPVLRRTIRGSVLGAKILGGLILGGLAIGGAAIFVAVSPIVVPAYFGYRIRKKRRLRQMSRRTISINFNDFIDAIERDMIAHEHNISPQINVKHENEGDSSTSAEDEEVTYSPVEFYGDDIENIDLDAIIHKSIDFAEEEPEEDEEENEEEEEDVTLYSTTVEIKKENRVHVSGGHKDNHITTANVETQDGGQVVLHVKTVTSSSMEETKQHENKGEEKEDVVSDKGCFIKILKRLPSVWEKEKDGEKMHKQDSMEETKITKEILTPPSDLKEGGRSNLESAKLSDTLEYLKQLQDESELKDPYCGLVATTDEITYL